MILKDDPKQQGKRKKLIQELKNMGIESDEVLQAMLKVPRHFFLDSSFEDFAYQNKAFPIGKDQTISHPYTVAFQSEVLEIKKGHKVLEVGTGSGYQTAVLFYLGAKVFSIERQHHLYNKAKAIRSKIHVKASLNMKESVGLTTAFSFLSPSFASVFSEIFLMTLFSFQEIDIMVRIKLL